MSQVEDTNKTLQELYKNMVTVLNKTSENKFIELITGSSLNELKDSKGFKPKNFADLMEIWRKLVRIVLQKETEQQNLTLDNIPNHLKANTIVQIYLDKSDKSDRNIIIAERILTLGIMRELHDSKQIIMSKIHDNKKSTVDEIEKLKTDAATAKYQLDTENNKLKEQIIALQKEQTDKDNALYDILSTLKALNVK